ncbi:MAG TPA: glycosyltransferase family 2 protein [Dehalococcoidia bacterium]|nr:glycosyltransferase family 2 protein [Dehalococcoidia bacterium]
MDNLPISVIIIVKNAEGTIGKCLESVRKNNPAEIIVVDGNSADRTVEIAGEYTEKIYLDEGRGKSYARQLGVEMATQEYIAYVDSDVFLMENTLRTMLNEFRNSSCASMCAREATDREYSNYWNWTRLQQQSVRFEVHLSTRAGLFNRETILKYPFDFSHGGYMDDLDLELRLRKDGYDFGVSSAFFHGQSIGLRSLVGQRYVYGRAATRYIWKYGPWHVSFWPPLVTLYWLGFCLIKGRLKLIPYFVVDGIIQTVGMVTGCFELIGEAFTRKADNKDIPSKKDDVI